MIGRRLLVGLLPDFVLTPLRQGKRYVDRHRRAFWRRFEPRVSAQGLLADLRRLGIEAGDTVLVHSALSKLGRVDGGPDTVIDALLGAVGERGTLLMPTLTTGGSAQRTLEANECFDYRSTPTTLGVINETFRSRPGVYRSIHPTHSVAGLGPQAEPLLAEHEQGQTPCGPLSPFAKLLDVDGKIAILGSPFSHLTSVHVLEDRVDYPVDVYGPQVFRASVVGRDGRLQTMSCRAHDPNLARSRIDNSPSKEQQILSYGLNKGYIAAGQVGRATCYIMGATALEQMLEELLKEGITIYDELDRAPK